jgi:hypothetical protein
MRKSIRQQSGQAAIGASMPISGPSLIRGWGGRFALRPSRSMALERCLKPAVPSVGSTLVGSGGMKISALHSMGWRLKSATRWHRRSQSIALLSQRL